MVPRCRKGRRWPSLEGGNRGLRSEARRLVLWAFDGGSRGSQFGSGRGVARMLSSVTAFRLLDV